MDDDNSGGFVRPVLSPPPSSLASTTAQVTLPQTRSRPLKSGSAKESQFIRYLDDCILRIQRRYAKRGSSEAGDVRASAASHGVGYRSFSEIATDIETLVGLIWVSGTPSLQTPYLLSLALLVTDYLPSFPAAPKATFRMLNKLDMAFASLLQGRNVETGEILPGFESGRAISGTEKVRMKSLVERTRLLVVNVIGGSGGTEASLQGEEAETETEDGYGLGQDADAAMDDEMLEEEERAIDRREMGIAKVYDRTMVELGDLLGGMPIGIITDD